MKLLSPNSAYWYQRNGVTCYTAPSLKDESYPTRPRDVCELGLLPSVTNILGLIAKWGVADSQTTRDGAADFGTAFHAGAERITHTLEVDRMDLLSSRLSRYRDWYQANSLVLCWPEKVLAHPECGYASTIDLLIEHPAHELTLVDLKTMKVKPGMKATLNKSWGHQLAAYRWALSEPVKCMNLIVNSLEPSAPIKHVWTDDEIETGWQAFMSAYRLRVIEKGYDPSAKASTEMMLAA